MWEAIGDECVRISAKTIESKGAKFQKELRKMFNTFHLICFGAHENALTAFLTSDIDLAEKVRATRRKVEEEFAKIEAVAEGQEPAVVPQILAVASFLRQIYEHSVDIADLAVPKKP